MMKRTVCILAAALMLLFASSCGKEMESYNAGIAAFREENYEEAIRSLLLAVSQGMDDAFVKADLALAYEKSGQMSKALEYLNAAVQDAPSDPAVLKRIGRFYTYAGDSITALRYLEVNGYLPSLVRVFTNEAGEFKPQILSEALHLIASGRQKITLAGSFI